ncbi:nitrile hydratase accessory protein [Halobacteriales archaeon QS_3_64_16]|nr:MAG: nitrile hydratase accessory protein [Halobacteriales archaeon QS_3_64_16]
MTSEDASTDRDVSSGSEATNAETTTGGRDDPEAERAFEAPWQARAFAIALATTEEGEHSWAAFQNRLAAEVEANDTDGEVDRPNVDSRDRTGVALDAGDREAAYYEQWLAALSELLIETETLSLEEIDARTRAFAEGERTAEEWVEGERDHDHGEDHSHSH